MRVNLLFDFNEASEQCRVSRDIYSEIVQDNNTGPLGPGLAYCILRFPSYDSHSKNRSIVYCTADNDLPLQTIKIQSRLLNAQCEDLSLDFCHLELFNEDTTLEVPNLSQLTLLINPVLYDKLKLLPNEGDILKFISAKYNLVEGKTVIHQGKIFSPQWCSIVDCSPQEQGVIDFKKTRVIILRDNDQILRQRNRKLQEQYFRKSPNQTFTIKGLDVKIDNDLITPTQMKLDSDDDTLFIFTNPRNLIDMNIPSGSNVELRNDNGITLITKIFTLLEPNPFDYASLYLPPRIMARFPNDECLTIRKSDIDLKNLPVAAFVSIARVNDWYQSQKLYQNVISKSLKDFFLKNNRILKMGDLIPVTFDSSMAEYYNNNNEEGDDCIGYGDDCNPDTLVWFRIENVRFRDGNDIQDDEDQKWKNKEIYFTIDPSGNTKIVTENSINSRLLPLGKCNYLSYYSLGSINILDPLIFPYVQRFKDILISSLKCSQKKISLKTLIMLHSTTHNTGKASLVKATAMDLGIHLINIDCMTIQTNISSIDSIPKVLGKIKAKIETVSLDITIPTIVFISHLETFFTQVDPNQDPTGAKLIKSFEIEFLNIINFIMEKNPSIIVVMSTNDIENTPKNVRSSISFEIELTVPTEAQRKEIFDWYLQTNVLNCSNSSGYCNNEMNFKYTFVREKDISLTQLAINSAGLTPLNIKSIVQNAKMKSFIRNCVERKSNLVWNYDQIYVTMDDLKSAIEKARDDFSVSIGAPKIPNVTWEDIGGVDIVKGEIMDTIDMPLRHPELFSSGMKQRSGILFYGPPGTGKTLLAKAIASNFSLNFFSVKGPELLNMYIGESEANVRRVFQRAREAKPCVIFFDEIDSVAPKRGNQGDSGGVMDRIVSQLLAELDGMSTDGDGLFVIGATNRPDLLDEALLRPGRFDKLLYLGISDTNEKQANILKALTRKFKLHDSVELSAIADRCPFNYTGADFYALCSDAMLNAMIRVAGEVDKKLLEYNKNHNSTLSINQWFDRVATEQDTAVLVGMQDFVKAQEELVPSVSQEELNHYLQVKHNFEG